MNYNIAVLPLRVRAGAMRPLVFLMEDSYRHALKHSRPL
jgi:hypothetical protein